MTLAEIVTEVAKVSNHIFTGDYYRKLGLNPDLLDGSDPARKRIEEAWECANDALVWSLDWKEEGHGGSGAG